ncbi:hypothetical protein AB8B21_16300 [Tardiphaga sp. 866_E4_N2_1]|jgi:hypothetical protein|uniref:hypothetical protein n=1 Tax=unclassified Tardiphaga TaxID=2631404 RepID=UPI0008A732E2|nr:MULTISPECIES: hypothetical protein [unclassified Tardiphaga]WPO41102.1 hypothetical protein SFY93_26855 [Tardiphaga sp. 42S5]SEH50405.1 hypothetical protein SAMN05216367_0746 [Tardiphaga sp. OK245]
MTAFDSLAVFSHDDRLWRIRAWLLERAILALSGDLRWALIGLGWRMVSTAAVQARAWVAGVIRRDGC